MNATCPNCSTVYRVDPAKVPVAGVRARCAVCSAVFAVRHGDSVAEPAASPALARAEVQTADPPAAPEPQAPAPVVVASAPPTPPPAPAAHRHRLQPRRARPQSGEWPGPARRCRAG